MTRGPIVSGADRVIYVLHSPSRAALTLTKLLGKGCGPAECSSQSLVVSDQGPVDPLAVADICHRQNVTVGSGRWHPPTAAL
jgi:hypothetical protein